MTLTGAALSAGSVLANSAASNQVASARNRVLQAERTRQQGFQQQEAATNEHSRALYDNFGGQQTTRGQQLGDYFNQGNGQQPGAGAAATGAGSTAPADTLPTSSNALVRDESARQGARAQAYSQQQGEALGGLRSFGDVLGTAGRAQARDAGTIDQLSNFSRGSAAVTPYELEAANSRGSGLRTLGDLLQGAGQVGMSAGLLRNLRSNPNTPIPRAAGAPEQSGTIDELGRALPALPTYSGIGNLFGGI